MKLYKFRSLSNEDEFKRVKKILESGEFWCSSFWELNDPMEGVYLTSRGVHFIDKIYKSKSKYKICSFSGKKGFNEPTLWGYYANGFKGVAIEIEIPVVKINKINYGSELPDFSDNHDSDETAKMILTSKLKSWEKEDEYRFLSVGKDNFHEIGKITSIYFGNPYANTINRNVTYEKDIIMNYLTKKDKLAEVAEKHKIPLHNVHIKTNEIVSFKF